MERRDIGKFVTKIAEAEVLFQSLSNHSKEEAFKIILSFCKRCEKFMSPKSQHSNLGSYLTDLSAADSSSCIIDQFYTPKLLVQSLLYDVVEKAITVSEEKELVWPSHRLRERTRSIQKLQQTVLDYGTADDTDDYDSEVNYATRKRKQTNPRRAVAPPIVPKSKKRKLSGSKVNVKESSASTVNEKEVPKQILKESVFETIKTRSSVSKLNNDRKHGRTSKRRVYSCEKCDETFTHAQSLYIHCQTIHSDCPRSCKKCRKEFYSEGSFSSHNCEEVKKEKLGPFLCRVCGDELKSKKLLSMHMKQHSIRLGLRMSKNKENTQIPKYICRFCSKGFVKKITLHKHYKQHSEGYLVCLKCGQFSKNEEEHAKHIAEHDKGAQFICLKCGCRFHRSRQYEQHLDAHARHDCQTCGKTLPTHKVLLRHCKEIHNQQLTPIEKVTYPCEFCEKKFSRPSMLEVHMRIHTGEKPIECSVCKIFFRTTKALAKHKQTYTHTIKAGEKPTDRKFLCSECGKAYFRKHALQRHMRYHSGDKPHTCEYCGYKCREVNNLKRHMSLHFEGERNFVCEICGSAFHAKKTLEMHHAYKHSEERNFSCSECSLTFKAKNALKRHTKVHTCEKDHKCWCGTGFKRMYNLRRHLKAVHGTDDLLPPVRRVQTLDKTTKLPIPKPPKKEDLHSRNLKKEIEILISESSNVSHEEDRVSVASERIAYVIQQEEEQVMGQPQQLHQEQHPHLHQQHTPVSTPTLIQSVLQRPQTPAPPRIQPADLRQQAADLRQQVADLRHHGTDLRHQGTDLRLQGADLRHQGSDLRQPTPDHLSPEDINSHRMRYNPSEPPSMMYGSLSLMDRQSAHSQPNHTMDPSTDPYMQMGSSSSFIPQAVAYSTILREYGSQFPFLQDGSAPSGGTYPSFVK